MSASRAGLVTSGRLAALAIAAVAAIEIALVAWVLTREPSSAAIRG